jgi:hypothetical protein
MHYYITCWLVVRCPHFLTTHQNQNSFKLNWMVIRVWTFKLSKQVKCNIQSCSLSSLACQHLINVYTTCFIQQKIWPNYLLNLLANVYYLMIARIRRLHSTTVCLNRISINNLWSSNKSITIIVQSVLISNKRWSTLITVWGLIQLYS